MTTLSKLLQQANELNIPHWNLMTKEDLQKAIKEIIVKYKEIVLGVNGPICMECLD